MDPALLVNTRDPSIAV